MICKKCGRVLQDNETFCSVCGEPVISFSVSGSEKEEGEKPKLSPLTSEFKWDVKGFPDREPHKTEDIDFDWNSGVDFPKVGDEEAADDSTESIKAEDGALAEDAAVPKAEEPVSPAAEAPAEKAPETDDSSMTDEGHAQAQTIDKYYTFNRKNE